MVLSEIINKLNQGYDLNKEDLLTIFNDFKEKKAITEKVKELIIAWHKKGEVPFEIKILANLIKEAQGQDEIAEDVVDVCGTGGDRANTFNISTCSAIVASSMGLKVIKHSGRSTTSITGSLDVLSEFGINPDLSKGLMEKNFEKYGLMFVSSSVLRNTFGEVKKICKELNLPAFVNLLGPLTNPYKTSFHLLGVSNILWGELLSDVLCEKDMNGTESLIICSKIKQDFYLDEFSFCGMNYFWRVKEGVVYKEILLPEDLGESPVNHLELIVKNEHESKEIFEGVLKGKEQSMAKKVKIVALNAGAMLYLVKKVKTLKEGYNQALLHIESGMVWEHFQGFVNSIKGG